MSRTLPIFPGLEVRIWFRHLCVDIFTPFDESGMKFFDSVGLILSKVVFFLDVVFEIKENESIILVELYQFPVP